MSMASLSSTADIGELAAPPRTSWWRGPRFFVEVFDGADEALAALEAVQGGLKTQASLSSTGFQSLNWMTVLYEELAAAKRSMPRLVVVTERNTGEVALILPLIVRKKRTLRIARFADFGVSDYGAPILGPALLTKRRSIRRAWRAVRYAMRDVDMIRLEKMPGEIADRPNPLISRAGVAPSRFTGNIVEITGTVEDYVAGLSDAFRQSLDRFNKFWERKGAPRFSRATTPEQIAYAYAALDEEQSSGDDVFGNAAVIEDPIVRQFYDRLVMDGTEVELGYLFTLEAGGETIATLFGIQHDDTFTLLRMSSSAGRWPELAPGRMVCIEAMKYFVTLGVRRFDFGLRAHPFKQGFGATEVPLYDLIVARDLAAVPRATFHRVKGRIRKNQRLRRFFRRIKRLRSG
jgi:CelD/BcsL family acetyltransferase involved in cellulose biosynthesis